MIAIFAALALLPAIFNTYLIRSEAAGFALWNSQEAYFFIYQDSAGRRVKWLAFPLLAVGEGFGRIVSPDDRRGVLFVLRVTPEGVERHDLELLDHEPGSGPGNFTTRDGRIWANYPAIGGLCWWSGDHFERATPDEQQRQGGIGGLDYHGYYRDQNGWSKYPVTEGSTTVASLHDGIELQAYGGRMSGREPLSIQMRKQGGQPTTLLKLDLRVGLASKAEYKNTFPQER
ncbi:MAG: hypothetical protein ABL967_18125 [Bryobacteraceae bacterium]